MVIKKLVKVVDVVGPASLYLPALVTWAILGALFRLIFVGVLFTDEALQASSVLSAPFLANVVGCFVFGFIKELSSLKGKALPAIFTVSITSWMCGSLTSFSSWNHDLLLKAFRKQPGPYILSMGIGIACFYSSVIFGFHMARAFLFVERVLCFRACHPRLNEKTFRYDRAVELIQGEEPTIPVHIVSAPTADEHPQSVVDYFVDTVSSSVLVNVILASLVSSGLILAIIFDTRNRAVWIACFFSVVGAFLRYHLSRTNTTVPHFPIGTFTANVIASIISTIAFVISYANGATVPSSFFASDLSAISDLGRAVFVIQQGLCGSLSTFSSFAGEMYTLPIMKSYLYTCVTIVVSQLSCAAILGFYLLDEHKSLA